MEEFRTLFLRLSKEHHVDPQESVCKKIHELCTENAVVLDLSNQTLTLATCDLLAKTLSHDLAFTSVVLSDCMLNEEGAKLLLSGLKNNTTIKTLDLRGNNLRQTGTEALGRYLKVGIFSILILVIYCGGNFVCGYILHAFVVCTVCKNLDCWYVKFFILLLNF